MRLPSRLSFGMGRRIIGIENCCVVPAFVETHQWAQAHFLFPQILLSRRQRQAIGFMAFDIEKVREIVDRVAASSGLEVVEVELRGGGKARMLRLVIDKPGGVTHEDCASLSREVGTILDVEDVVPGLAYTLEVSSPGLDRKLSLPADFERFVGSRVKLMTRNPVHGGRHFEGRLESFSEGKLMLDTTPAKKKLKAEVSGQKLEIELGNVEKANLVPEF